MNHKLFSLKNVTLSLMALALSLPTRTLAYGKRGHQLVAQIGYDMMSDNAKAAVTKYLGGIAIPDAGTWMDDQRNNPVYAYMKPWHFINLDKGEQYQPSTDQNVVNEINIAIDNLKHKENLSDDEIKLNILVLFHLVGDITQPLHDGYGSDKGGNDITVKYLGKKSNLHKVWDSEMLEGGNVTKENCTDLAADMTDEQKDQVRVIDAVAWMKDSRELLPAVYRFEDNSIDPAYVARNTKVVEKQVLYGGMRLAAVMDELFPAVASKATMANRHAVTPKNNIVTLPHHYYTSHFSTSLHIPWVVEYTLHKKDVNCSAALKRTNRFAADPENKAITDLDKDYTNSGYDRGHNMPAADNGCNGADAMTECFYFSNMFPQTHRLNAGVWKTLEEQERDMAIQDDSVYVWIGNYGIAKTIGPDEVAVPKYCWKVIYDYKTREWAAYIFPNTLTVTGKPEDFTTTVQDLEEKSGYHFQ